MAQHPRTVGSEAVSAFPGFSVPESLLTRSYGPQCPTERVQEAKNTDPQGLGVMGAGCCRGEQCCIGAWGTLRHVRLPGHFPHLRRRLWAAWTRLGPLSPTLSPIPRAEPSLEAVLNLTSIPAPVWVLS